LFISGGATIVHGLPSKQRTGKVLSKNKELGRGEGKKILGGIGYIPPPKKKGRAAASRKAETEKSQ
jgi:hypothetical protein